MVLHRWDPGIGKDEGNGGDKAYHDNLGERRQRLSSDLVIRGKGFSAN